MTDLAVNLVKVAFVAVLYLFLFFVARAVGRHLVRSTPPSGPVLILRSPGRGLRTVEVRRPLVIGRSPDTDLPIEEDAYASGRHARFEVVGDRLFVEDLGSTNGTQVNGHLVPGRTPLSSGDNVVIGESTVEIG